MGLRQMTEKDSARLFTHEEMLSDSASSDILKRAAEVVRHTPLLIDRAKQEQEAWSQVKDKIVGAEV